MDRTGQGWNLHLRRNWEMPRIAAFYNTVAHFNNLTGERNTLEWKADSKGNFTVKSAYRDLCSTTNQEAGWPWRMIWKTKIPYKVNCFSWLLAKEVVLTHENLNKRGFHLCSRCYLCGEQAETVNHLFLHCKVTDQLWQLFLKMKKINWVKSGNIKEVMKCWNRDGNAAKKEKRWKIVPASIWWTVWKERNQRCFEDKQSSMQKMKMNCLAIYYFWCKEEMVDQTADILTAIDWL
ncbi:uncharacterized protein LOC132061211 [Lycium ferocissimum]|uniref:uncharacterized protein LOC132061211 n=1 Tax=Lycium ferocissimum TaxID=112874 RepID=UPI00281581D2|nr:uncharacterized protein LOC132061211 [Lycium ferocissimum]